MLVLSWMVCSVRLSTNSGCSSGKKGGSVSERYHEIPVLAVQRLDWRFIVILLPWVGLRAWAVTGNVYYQCSSVRIRKTLTVSNSDFPMVLDRWETNDTPCLRVLLLRKSFLVLGQPVAYLFSILCVLHSVLTTHFWLGR